MNDQKDTYWWMIWRQFHRHPLGRIALYVILLFCLMGIYAPLLASSKPLVVQYEGTWYFPLFRYLFYRGFYTKPLDIFFNLLMLTVPIASITAYFTQKCKWHLRISLGILAFLQGVLFLFFVYGSMQNPAADVDLIQKRQEALRAHSLQDWNFALEYMTPYAKLNLILNAQISQQHDQKLRQYTERANQKKERFQKQITEVKRDDFPSLWQQNQNNEDKEIIRLKNFLNQEGVSSSEKKYAENSLNYMVQKQQWLINQQTKLKYEVLPLIRPFHWEDDAGGSQALNKLVPFWELTRINRSDLMAALIFGIRISLVVGVLAIFLALLIGLPMGALAGFYGGTFDILLSRFLEIWEAMPTFFMLLMIVAILQSKSIFIVIAIIGLFGWTSFSRYIRGEFFKQRNLPYVEACRAQGFKDSYIMFSHILPNAIPPVLTLLPFAIMGAITSEAGLSFLGLGEEGSCSWGVLMDEGRSVFPGESYLLWPPAILLTFLLVAIALVGDSFRDALDPKMHREK